MHFTFSIHSSAIFTGSTLPKYIWGYRKHLTQWDYIRNASVRANARTWILVAPSKGARTRLLCYGVEHRILLRATQSRFFTTSHFSIDGLWRREVSTASRHAVECSVSNNFWEILARPSIRCKLHGGISQQRNISAQRDYLTLWAFEIERKYT